MLLSLLCLALPVGDTLPPNPPGYWQQEVAYEITAKLEEPLGILRGEQLIHYRNRSPDTLRTFSLHLHLNAFRPGSRWSDGDSVEQRRRFNDLKDPDYGYNHVANVKIMGRDVKPVYPFAPDSTIVRFDLPAPLAPGDSMVVTMEWDARLSTVARRQGRRGRHYDFAHWYPKVVVYDRFGWNENPLVAAGEFYGEFATYRVQLDVPEDQVVGMTGVPLCGDPGWAGANQAAGVPVQYGAEVYPEAAKAITGPGPGKNGACAFHEFFRHDPEIASGFKRLLLHAELVHHFALSMDPQYRYEGATYPGGAYGSTLVHVLYRPGDEKEWGSGIAVKRTLTSLAWLDQLYGPFGWPQITNLHRIDGGGTEFPMMIMDGSASQGLINHELGHNYTMGLLANNEWREGFLDEGFTSFQSSWFDELVAKNPDASGYRDLESQILVMDLDQWSEPVSLPASDYSDFIIYNQMIYSRAELLYHQLRYVVGDSVMHQILRTYYDRWKYKHVDEGKFRAVVEEVSGQDFSALFGQWLHGDVLYDYAVGRVKRTVRGSDGQTGGWSTRIEVIRLGDGMMPVDVAVIAKGDTAVVRTDGKGKREWVEVVTRTEPKEVRIDPDVRAHDWNMLNNRYKFGTPFHRAAPSHNYFDTFFTEERSREKLERGWMPTIWYNDAGGITLGLRSRENYMGKYEQNQFLLSYSLGEPSDIGIKNLDFFARIKDPVWLRAPRQSQRMEAFHTEGRWGGLLGWGTWSQEHLTFGPRWTQGYTLRLVDVDDDRFVDPGQWDDVGIVELASETGWRNRSGKWQLASRLVLAGGLAFNQDGLSSVRPDLDPFYFRGELDFTARRTVAKALDLGARIYGGVASGSHAAAKQRQVYLGMSDPFTQLNNPFLRSKGSLLVGDDFAYQAPGGANVRAADFRVSAPALVAMNAELERTVRNKRNGKLFNRVGVAVFGDGAYGIGGDPQPLSGEELRFIADAGVGLRANHRIGTTSFMTRFDFPFYLSKPEYARNDFARDNEFDFRWLVSLQAAF